MKLIVCLAVLVAFVAGPIAVHAQHGRGGGGPGGGYRGGFGSGYGGRGMGTGRPTMAAAPRPGVAVGHPYAGRHNAYFSNRPVYHGGWYRGDWNGHWAGPWGYRPWGWGWYGGWGPGWGLGMGWGFGGTTLSVGVGSPWNWANNFLILSASDQNSLVGQVSMEAGDKLNFRLAGGNPAEPGLTFTR